MTIITISRGTLSGGADLAEQLGKRLGFQVISRELIVEAAKTYGLTEVELREGLEVPPGLWQRITHEKERYVLAAQAALAEVLKDEDCVYHGYCGQLLVKDQPCAIRLRLIAPLEQRVKTAMSENNLSRDAAMRMIQLNDEQRAKWVRTLSGYDVNDPALYDMVINLEMLDIEAAVQMVELTVRQQKAAETAEDRQKLQDFLLERRVKAAFTFRSSFPAGSIEVGVSAGRVHLAGPFNGKDWDPVVKFVAGIPGVSEVLAGDWQSDFFHAGGEGKTAKDIMLALNRYPSVQLDVTIRDALIALGSSVVALPDGERLRPRFLLVFDADHNLVGLVNRRSLIAGLIPGFKTAEHAMERAHGYIKISTAPDPAEFLWPKLFSREAIEQAHSPLSTVMRPIRGTVSTDTPLSLVVGTMLQQDVDLVPVKDGTRTVGVILMTQLFDAVAELVVEGSASRRSSQSDA